MGVMTMLPVPAHLVNVETADLPHLIHTLCILVRFGLLCSFGGIAGPLSLSCQLFFLLQLSYQFKTRPSFTLRSWG